MIYYAKISGWEGIVHKIRYCLYIAAGLISKCRGDVYCSLALAFLLLRWSIGVIMLSSMDVYRAHIRYGLSIVAGHISISVEMYTVH